MTPHPRAGDRLPSLAVPRVRIEDVHTIMDVMGDVNPVHVDEALVRRLGLRGPVNQGPANAGYVLNMALGYLGHPGSIRQFRFRFESISTPGDDLVAGGEVVDVSAHQGATRLACDVRLDRVGGERILVGRIDAVVLPDGER